jgi:uncharacterized membrane-anchored protein YitT (DUF2179 family)
MESAVPAVATSTPIPPDAHSPPPHSLFEDVVALVIGTSFVSFGVAMYSQSGLLTGGTAGIAFLLHYLTGSAFGIVFFLINLPFYYLAWRRMGWRFTAKTFAAVALVSLFSSLHTMLMPLHGVPPFYAALMGGFVMGTGFVILFRHGASLGGVNVLALHLQERHGIRAGHFQLVLDLLILASSYFVVSTTGLLASIAGAVALNLVIALNHRKGRYMAL